MSDLFNPKGARYKRIGKHYKRSREAYLRVKTHRFVCSFEFLEDAVPGGLKEILRAAGFNVCRHITIKSDFRTCWRYFTQGPLAKSI